MRFLNTKSFLNTKKLAKAVLMRFGMKQDV